MQGGTIIAIGGLERGANITGGTCKQASSWTSETWYALYDGEILVAAFKTPTKSSTSSDGGNRPPGGGGGPGGGPGGGGSQALVVYTSGTPTLSSGVTVNGGVDYFNGLVNLDGSVSGGSSVTLNTYNSGGR